VRCAGQSVGTTQELQRELKFLSSAPPVPMTYWKAVNYFAGSGGWSYTSAPMKGKSDYATSPLPDAGLSTLMSEINRRGSVYVICDSYGGSIASVAPDATAFTHPVRQLVDKPERYAPAPQRHAHAVRGDATVHVGGRLRELLRS
jgi:hypothetical protein